MSEAAMSAADRLERALLDAADCLVQVVGFPANPEDEYGERIPISGCLVNRDEVPDSAYRAACCALQFTMLGAELMDPGTESIVSVEDGLAALTKGDKQG